MEEHVSRRLAILATATGDIVALSAVSPASAEAGLRRQDFIGKKLWDFSPQAAVAIQRRFAAAAQQQVEQSFYVDSDTGRIERWSCRYIPATRDAKVLVIAERVANDMGLKTRDLETLRLLASDHTVPQIAMMHGINERSVRARIDVLKQKFGVKTTHGLVGAVARAGY